MTTTTTMTKRMHTPSTTGRMAAAETGRATGIRVRRATTAGDREKVFDLRFQGYGKYFASRSQVIDRYDRQTNVTLFLATDESDRPVGTIRVLDRSSGEIELDGFLNLRRLFTPAELPAVEATRFTVPRSPRSQEIKLALWKSFYDYSRERAAKTMVIWARRGAARMYRRLLFEDMGPQGEFRHPRLNDLPHRTYQVYLPTIETRYRELQHPLTDLFFGPPRDKILCA